MQTVENIFELSQEEIDYRIGSLSSDQKRILNHLLDGTNDFQLQTLLSISMFTLKARLASACDRVGVSTRSQLVGLYAIWTYGRTKSLVLSSQRCTPS